MMGFNNCDYDPIEAQMISSRHQEPLQFVSGNDFGGPLITSTQYDMTRCFRLVM